MAAPLSDPRPVLGASPSAAPSLLLLLLLLPPAQAAAVAHRETPPERGPRLEPPRRVPEKLQEVRVPLIPLPLCQLVYGHLSHVMSDMLCAGDIWNVRTVCEGDSGGPLVCDFNHTWLQVGVVSWGRGCTYPMYPAVYARVSYFSKWIHYYIEHTPVPLQPLPALSLMVGATVSVPVTMLAVLSML
ncbi:serine protease 38 [Phoca vitulina]|uniref:serine protease 38 n=1 Tax=Phoca vitulina TaxID=9720 RepID=UPI0013966343|nr:serine protease 38 [Phoca vitulina]